MAVLVMEMLKPQAAFVLHTASPLDRDEVRGPAFICNIVTRRLQLIYLLRCSVRCNVVKVFELISALN